MVCGGFSCSKNCLCALNLLYTKQERWGLPAFKKLFLPLKTRLVTYFFVPKLFILECGARELVSLLLIGIAAWGIGFGLISSFRVVGVAVAVGIFLFLIALVGLIGAIKHHQVLLFFYMIILLLVFVIQFSVSCACLTLNKEQQSKLLEVGWNNTNNARQDVQRNLNCCGFHNVSDDTSCSAECFETQTCKPCAPIIKEYSEMVLRFVGGIGLFFSFTEILGVWLTYRYRNQKDPRANPSAFL